MSISASPTRTGAIAGKEIKRTKEKMFWVKSPAGEIVEINQSNAFDLVNHNGWSFHKPVIATAVETPAEALVEAAAEKVAATPKDEEVKELTVIDKLRAEAVRLGIDVDARWGQRTLNEKIDEAKDALEAKAEADAEEADEA